MGRIHGQIQCQKRPNIVKNILPLSGFYNSEITKSNANSKFKLNCFTSHGINDPVIPIEWAQKGVRCIENNNHVNIIFKQYDSGHEINSENLKDVIKWLNKN